MKVYLLSLGAGLLVGIVYSLLGVRSPARPVVALIGLLGIDAGGGFQNYPDDYEIIEKLHQDGQLTVRISYNLFTQKPKEELADFSGWVKQVTPGQGDDSYRHNGAGEMLEARQKLLECETRAFVAPNSQSLAIAFA